MAAHVFGAKDTDAETIRSDALEELFEGSTQRRLEALALPRGGRFLEVGAGRGATVMFLLSRCGATGHVVATDVDTRWLEQYRHPNLTTLRHDIVSDDVGPLARSMSSMSGSCCTTSASNERPKPSHGSSTARAPWSVAGRRDGVGQPG